MDRVELAERRYQQLVPRPVRDWADFPTGALLVWLADDVGPVVEDYSRRPAFREQATWPLRVLAPGAAAPERGLVEAVDRAVVTAARALRRLGRNRLVRHHLVTQHPPRATVTSEAVALGGRGPPTLLGREEELVDHLGVALAQIDAIAGRFWADLVCPEDYLEPRGGWRERSGHGPGTPGEFVVSLNPQLHPVGDFVTRCLGRRVDTLCGLLQTFRSQCLQAVAAAGRAYPRQRAAAEQSWEELTQAVADLRRRCATGRPSQLRDACIVLTQVYLAFHPLPEGQWLGLPAPVLRRGTAALRHRFRHGHSGEMAERIAAALGELRRLYEEAPRRQGAVEEAIAGGGLVLVADPPAAYWDGERIVADWKRYPMRWRLLRELAAKARLGAAVAERDLYEHARCGSLMATTLGRLKALLPPTLRKHVVPGTATRSYRLGLEPHRLHFFEQDRPRP